ncbi:MAG TPA: AAA family ATPase, partial [Gemmataceae bacterium]|nr:AAA family ATPase [Gemmataceae bacterium]
MGKRPPGPVGRFCPETHSLDGSALSRVVDAVGILDHIGQQGAGMFRSVTFKNFRGFQDLTLGGLSRVNLIAGKNNAGKTAALEGVFLLIAPNLPELTLRIHALRGIEQIAALETWEWLFYDRKVDTPVRLEAETVQGTKCSLALRLTHAKKTKTVRKRKKGQPARIPEPGSLSTAAVKQLIVEYTDPSGGRHISHGIVSERGLEWERASMPLYPIGFLLTPRGRNHSEDIERFSRLAEVGREQEIVKALQALDKRIKDLKMLVTSGNLPMFYAEVGLSHLVPLSLMGDGVDRLLSMMCAVLLAKGGTVLIDEMENGLHHSVMKDVWKAVGLA